MKYKIKLTATLKYYEISDEKGNSYFIVRDIDESTESESYDMDSYDEKEIGKTKKKEIIEAIIKYEKKKQ